MKYFYALLFITICNLHGNAQASGPRFSFALIHNNEQMVIYLPFVNNDFYYAIDFKFRTGKFLFDFEMEDQEKMNINSNVPYYIIEKINWKEQGKKWKKSTYANDDTYNKIRK